MLHFLLASCLFTTPLSVARFQPNPTDSVGVVVQGGKTFLKHKIGKGDTFYSLARRYHVPMQQIIAANPKVQSTLSIGQIVLIPRSVAVLTDAPAKPKKETADAPAPAKPTVTEAPAPAAARTHTVRQGETLSGIARKYHTSIGALRRLNNLRNDNLRLKQVLVVSAAAAEPDGGRKAVEEHAVAPPRDEVTRTEERARDEPRKEEAKREEPKREVTEQPRRPIGTDAADDTTAGTEVAESLRKVTESGIAEVIDGSTESSKYLALHRAAPVGTILQVKNPQNGQSVYVRVIGKLPPTGANENVIIRLSKRAVQKLAVVDSRFRVEVSYMP